VNLKQTNQILDFLNFNLVLNWTFNVHCSGTPKYRASPDVHYNPRNLTLILALEVSAERVTAESILVIFKSKLIYD
jgi:hypothetical protein